MKISSDYIDWINKRNGNYRCLVCGFQFHDGKPRTHLKEHEAEICDADNEHEYAFDVTLSAVIRVKAMTLEEARARIFEYQSVTVDSTHQACKLTEVSSIIKDVVDPFEIDGIDMEA